MYIFLILLLFINSLMKILKKNYISCILISYPVISIYQKIIKKFFHSVKKINKKDFEN